MNMFGRQLVPISEKAFSAIEEQARSTLRENLSARKFVDVKGPLGWEHASVSLGRLGKLEKDGPVGYGVRQVIPLVEFRVNFTLDVMELHDIDRGASDPDLSPVEHAAIDAAAFEDGIVYRGFKKAGIAGMEGTKGNAPLTLSHTAPEEFLKNIQEAIQKMKTRDSISGPFALVGGKRLNDAMGKIFSCCSLFEIVESNTEVDELIFTPSFDGAFLVSKRGGDFELTLGGDFTVGYSGKDAKNNLTFFLTESLAFRIHEPRTFVPLLIE